MKNEKIAVIGNGIHGKRIQKILKNKNKNFFVFTSKDLNNKKKIIQLHNAKIIFIISPNKTHANYLKQLNSNSYIFCEKPPVTNKKDLKYISKLNYRKIYFNFNKRFSFFVENIKKIKKKYELGELIYGNMIISKGLALKNDYKNSWRSNIKKNKKGVFETVSIHEIDLVNYLFNFKKINQIKLKNFSKIGTSFDTSFTRIELKNDAYVDIVSTYFSSLFSKYIFLFKNGVIEFDKNNFILRYPTKSFNKKNMFKEPKIVFQKKLIKDNDYNISLIKSVDYFLKIDENKKNFLKKDFDVAIHTNQLIL